ncbi:hypothetical protein J8F10_18850 [Gemmata sp. G18]|uniref:Lipoprotein SmpA/OmlA domain-containing protein n=1 Tax=Gemmata palustris TaxID=2822762 RepID=A0ABS5BUE5_9BACT|nr:hypothetical protein [Gemmata palustris]MBP3957308.1 hypothetical protein [Gemmata palustris]
MRGPAKCLCLVVLVALLGGCSKKVSEENAKKVQPGMTLSEVEALLGSGRKDGADQYEWTTEKGKLKLGFSNNKVTRIEYQGAPRVVTEEEQAAEKARSDAKWAEQKKDSDRVAQDRDRINALNDVYALLFAAVGAGDRLPANEAAAAASPLANVNKGMDAIRSGRVVVRWGAAITDDVWAYEKDAPTKGGYAVGEKYTQPEKLTAEQLRPFAAR